MVTSLVSFNKSAVAALGILVLLASGCMSTKLALNDKWDPRSKPKYVDYFDFYLFGFVGDATVNVQKACVDQKPYAVQRIKTAEDGILTFLTLGIYAPTTVKVWCGD